MNPILCCHLERQIKLIYDIVHIYVKCDILVAFESPDGSTYWGHKYNNLVNSDHPDGSTSWAYTCYYILVKFESPDGSTC